MNIKKKGKKKLKIKDMTDNIDLHITPMDLHRSACYSHGSTQICMLLLWIYTDLHVTPMDLHRSGCYSYGSIQICMLLLWIYTDLHVTPMDLHRSACNSYGSKRHPKALEKKLKVCKKARRWIQKVKTEQERVKSQITSAVC